MHRTNQGSALRTHEDFLKQKENESNASVEMGKDHHRRFTDKESPKTIKGVKK